jgi:iron complex outermembrane receptor protein
VVINNANAQRSFGAEGSVNLNLASWWKLSAAEAWQQLSQINVVGVSGDSLGRQFSLETPHQMFNVRSTFLLPRNVEFDVGSYYVSRLLEQQVPSYVRLDMRLGWRPSPQLELSFGGHNLLQDQHTEYGPVLGLLPTAVRRNAYARATWRF